MMELRKKDLTVRKFDREVFAVLYGFLIAENGTKTRIMIVQTKTQSIPMDTMGTVSM